MLRNYSVLLIVFILLLGGCQASTKNTDVAASDVPSVSMITQTVFATPTAQATPTLRPTILSATATVSPQEATVALTAKATRATNVTKEQQAAATSTADAPTHTTRPTRTSRPPTKTPTQTPTETPLPTNTPVPSLNILLRVESELTGKPIEAAQLTLSNDRYGYEEVGVSNELGRFTFGTYSWQPILPNGSFLLLIDAKGFLHKEMTLTAAEMLELHEDDTTLIATLTDMVMVRITRINLNIRTGPDTEYASLGLAVPNEEYRVIGLSGDEEWLLIDTDIGVNSWVKIMTPTMRFEGDLDALPLLDLE